MEKSIFEIIEKKILNTPYGPVAYWVSNQHFDTTLVFLHGLTADHTLFEKQIPHYLDRFNIICWDTPAHGMSRPYRDFTYFRAGQNLKAILEKEQIGGAVFVGQSMGGFITQTILKYWPEIVTGFVGIDTCPFGLGYYSKSDMWWLRQIEWMSLCFPCNLLKKSLAKSCTYSQEARQSYYHSLSPYSKKELCHLLGIGYAGFLEENCDLNISCPVLILVGKYDRTGKVWQYCTTWARKTGFPMRIIPNAAHNANFDNSEAVNLEIDRFLEKLE